jgi:hypothetical protein
LTKTGKRITRTVTTRKKMERIHAQLVPSTVPSEMPIASQIECQESRIHEIAQ